MVRGCGLARPCVLCDAGLWCRAALSARTVAMLVPLTRSPPAEAGNPIISLHHVSTCRPVRPSVRERGREREGCV